MTWGYLISSGALEIGVRLRCQRLRGIFIGSEHKLIRAAISEGLLASCSFRSEEIWIHRRMPKIQL